MNKQKTLIFSLSVMLFLTASFLVYSWSEPKTEMPGTYSIPLNTSGTAQTKTGELTVPIIYDSEGGRNYYLNPSGDSNIFGKIISSTLVSAEDASGTIATKGYVDGIVSNVTEEVTLANVVYVSGNNVSCPEDTIAILRNWVSVYCNGVCSYCTTAGGWIDADVPTCNYTLYNSNCLEIYGSRVCTASQWTEALCVQSEEVLNSNLHTGAQCRVLGGTVVTVEDNVKICKFPVTTTGYTQRTYPPNQGGPYTRVPIYGACPSGWIQYKNFMSTKIGRTWTCSDFYSMVRQDSDQSHPVYNVAYGTNSCVANSADNRTFKNTTNYDACGVYCTSSYTEQNGYYYGGAEVIESGCY